jgi:hypothetical protein
MMCTCNDFCVTMVQGIMVEKMNQDEDEKSVLQNKLDDMTRLITRAGMLAGSHMPPDGSLCPKIFVYVFVCT